jgi:hypothetical protein
LEAQVTTNEDGPYWENQSDIDRERCGDDCDCRRDDPPEKWCHKHDDWREEQQAQGEEETYVLTPAGRIVAAEIARNYELRSQIERLRAERDEARRLYCVRCAGSRAMERDIALRRGWVDLFPEGHGR